MMMHGERDDGGVGETGQEHQEVWTLQTGTADRMWREMRGDGVGAAEQEMIGAGRSIRSGLSFRGKPRQRSFLCWGVQIKTEAFLPAGDGLSCNEDRVNSHFTSYGPIKLLKCFKLGFFQ